MSDSHSQQLNPILVHKRELLAQYERRICDCTIIADRAQDPARVNLYRGQAESWSRMANDLRAEIANLEQANGS